MSSVPTKYNPLINKPMRHKEWLEMMEGNKKKRRGKKIKNKTKEK